MPEWKESEHERRDEAKHERKDEAKHERKDEAKQEKPQGKLEGKPTIGQENHDENVGPREQTGATSEADKVRPEEDERGLHYGQCPGSTIAEDNDVE